MKKTILAAAVLALGAMAAQPALAGGSKVHVGVGLSVGVPVGGYYGYGYGPYYPYYRPYYSYPPAYYPAPVVVQQQPLTYIEQPAAEAAQSQAYWYYCAASRAYYPYVKDCPAGWQRVAPQPGN